MFSCLLVSARLHDSRYHGAGDWPPAPARLFQALVAGAVRGGVLDTDQADALRWLETLPAPVIAAPRARPGEAFTVYVPNNDLDAVGGHPREISRIRSPKLVRPWLIEGEPRLFYAWSIDRSSGSVEHGLAVKAMAQLLYQFGRGVDMACAVAETLSVEEVESRLAACRGVIHRPGSGSAGLQLACPTPGSLDSLIGRHTSQGRRFSLIGNRGEQLFTQPPQPRFVQVTYDNPPHRCLFDLRQAAEFAPWPLARAAGLVETLRVTAAARLSAALPGRQAEIERLLIGRGAAAADLPLRPRLVPLPSVGATHADHAIRRVLLEVPGACPLPKEDLVWALSGLSLPADQDIEAGEVPAPVRLLCAEDDLMLRHFGVGVPPARRWRSVTPVALPDRARTSSPQAGSVREAETQVDAAALRQAMRHAGINTAAVSITLQCEPFAAHGARAEAFAPGTRFTPPRLRHAEITFAAPLTGPLLLGDGRFLGLGLFAPVCKAIGLWSFRIVEGLVTTPPDPMGLSRALRRAVMARVQDRLGSRQMPAFFSGHSPGGAPLREGRKAHLAFTCNPGEGTLCVVAPHHLEARAPTREESEHLDMLEAALDGLSELRAGAAGLLRLTAEAAAAPSLLDPSMQWTSVTPYTVTRHTKHSTPAEVLVRDVHRECMRRKLPAAEVAVLQSFAGEDGLSGMLRLRFDTAQPGPLLLGRNAHLGGGLFRHSA